MKPSLWLILAALLWSCNVQVKSEDDAEGKEEEPFDEATTQTVLDHHWQTFRDNDLEGVMADYSEESILITPDKTFRGLDEIRQNFVNAFAAFPRDSTQMTLQQSEVVGDVGYIIWSAATPGFTLSFGTDTFIIRGGKIIRQTYAGVAGDQ
jgi:hypothetical protein